MRKLLVFQHAAAEPLGVLDPMLRRWLSVPAYRAEAGGEGADRILRTTPDYISPALRLSERVFAQFMELFEWRRTPALRLASR